MTARKQGQRVAIILAAGKGTRMKSVVPKVLHQVAGRAMIDWSIALARGVDCSRIIVVCSPQQTALRAHVEAELGTEAIAIQDPPLGTGHAVLTARQAAGDAGDVVVLYGDTPLIRPETIESLFEVIEAGACIGVLGFEAADPGAYGRLVLNNDGALEKIVEARDATMDELAITLCNSGVMAASAADMFKYLSQVTNENAKGEYYLTDIVGLSRDDDQTNAVIVCEEADVQGVNSRAELASANGAYQQRQRASMMAEGVTLEAPETVFFSYDTQIEADVTIEPNVVFGPGVDVKSGAHIRAFSHLEGAQIASGAVVGPYARLRAGAEIGAGAKIGNFVEVKKTRVGEGAKLNHLTYAGDGEIGAGANIGAGTIFCNYDGYNKSKTVIGAGAFVGSNSSLVAPVRIGDGAYVGSGSVITQDVEDNALSVARGKQMQREGWATHFRARMEKDDGDGK